MPNCERRNSDWDLRWRQAVVPSNDPGYKALRLQTLQHFIRESHNTVTVGNIPDSYQLDELHPADYGSSSSSGWSGQACGFGHRKLRILSRMEDVLWGDILAPPPTHSPPQNDP
ncbi:unnamed protein product [Pleuronectes platessa]|uniref:Uncharacterized protein n=1 Tax=Pleuronectes platessa TaxID=8262 RepID=A0A9N7VEJ6_PLEPL|nr:unnamed protein product [Pleuronectes platessa]